MPTGCAQCVTYDGCNAQCYAYDRDNGGRVEGKLIALYPLDEGSGASVGDRSGVGTALDLSISSLASGLQWLSPQGLEQTTVAGSGPKVSAGAQGTKLETMIGAQNGFTVEAWYRTYDLAQGGPKRIVTISSGTSCPAQEFFQFGQAAGSTSYRLSTTTAGYCSGGNSLYTSTTDLHHTFYDYSSATRRIIANGTTIFTEAVGATLNTGGAVWSGFELVLFNEATSDRMWAGALYAVAIYDDVLSASTRSEHQWLGYAPLRTIATVDKCGICAGASDCCVSDISPPGGMTVNASLAQYEIGDSVVLECTGAYEAPLPYANRDVGCLSPDTWGALPSSCAHFPARVEIVQAPSGTYAYDWSLNQGYFNDPLVVRVLEHSAVGNTPLAVDVTYQIDIVSGVSGVIYGTDTCTANSTVTQCVFSGTRSVRGSGEYVMEVSVLSFSGDWSGYPTSSVTPASFTFNVSLATNGAVVVPENQINLIDIRGNDASFTGWSVVGGTCPGMSITFPSAITMRLATPALNYETLPQVSGAVAAANGVPTSSHFCTVQVAQSATAFSQWFTVFVSDADDPTVLVGTTISIVDAVNVTIAFDVSDEDGDTPELVLRSLPPYVSLFQTGNREALYEPSMANPSDPNEGVPPPLRRPILPGAIPVNSLAFELIVEPATGTYETNFTVAVSTINGVSVTATQANNMEAVVFLSVAIPCPDPVGMILDSEGLCACAEAGTFINLDDQCELCPQGTFYTGVVSRNPCQPCPGCAYCDGALEPARAQEGCYEGPPGVFTECTPPSVCLLNGVCAGGNSGFLCADCIPGYYKENGVCAKCPSMAPLILALLFVFIIVICVVLVKLARRSAAYFTSLAVGFSFLQVIAILASFRLKWPGFVQDFFNVISLINFNVTIFRPECAVAGGQVDYEGLWLAKLFLPFIFLLVIVIGNVGATVYSLIRRQFQEERSPWVARFPRVTRTDLTLLRNASVNAYITIMMLLYLVLVAAALEIFDCENGRMVKDTRIECGSSKWKRMLGWSIAFMIVYGAGIPVMFWGVLWVSRFSLMKELVIVKFGLLYRRYQPQYYLWELVVLFRKLGIVIGLLLFSSVPPQAILAMTSLAVSLAAHAYAQPYLTPRVNRLESIHLWCSIIVLVGGLALFWSGENADESTTTAIGVIVILIVSVNIVAIVVAVSVEIVYQRRRIKHGVSEGFASDEVVVDQRFFAWGVFIREHDRNLMGTATQLVLHSNIPLYVRAEYCNAKGQIISNDLDDRCSSFSQSNGTTHVFSAFFQQVGRYQLRVYGMPIFEGDTLDADAQDVDMGIGMTRLDMVKADQTGAGSGAGTDAGTHATGERRSRRISMAFDANKALLLQRDATERTLHPAAAKFLRVCCSYEPQAALRPLLSFGMNCDVRPPAVVSFPRFSRLFRNRDGVLVHPLFHELSHHTMQHFAVHIAGVANIQVSAECPSGVGDGTPLFRTDDGAYCADISFTEPGAVSVWARFFVDDGESVEDLYEALEDNGDGGDDHRLNSYTSIQTMSMMSLDSPMGDADAINPLSLDGGDGTGPPGATRAPFTDTVNNRVVSPYVRLVSFVVLAGQAGWEKDPDRKVEKDVMDALVDQAHCEPLQNLIATYGPQAMDILPAPKRLPAFAKQRAILEMPPVRHLLVNVEVPFLLRIPPAIEVVLSADAPTPDAPGIPLFKTGNDAWSVTKTFDMRHIGPLCLWARSVESTDTPGGGGGLSFMSSRPQVGAFERLVRFKVVSTLPAHIRDDQGDSDDDEEGDDDGGGVGGAVGEEDVNVSWV